MVKGGKTYSSMSNDGKWFAHQSSAENDTKTREMCTSTGIMLTQVKTSLPQALYFKRYPKWKTEQKARVYPFSDHDNKHALKDNVCVFNQDVGLKKCLDNQRQYNSHFCLCHNVGCDTGEGTGGNATAYQTDFKEKQAVDAPASARRFARNHKEKSAKAALAQAEEQFMWFGQHHSDISKTPPVLVAANCSASCKP